jgi:hypothetical protein
MPLPDDPLQELRRQRALVQEHLAWLDRQIASASGETAPKTAAANRSAAAPAPADSTEADAILESYQAESRSMPATVRRGCLIVFAAGVALFALGVFALYLYVRSHQPGAGH